MDLLAILPNLSIGVISVLSLVYVIRLFISTLDTQHREHMIELKERETAMRQVEKEVRSTITTALLESTKVIADSNRIIDSFKRQ